MNDYYESRQHLNLSQLAFDTIENDKFYFLERPSLAKIINKVFAAYRDYADASIENACARYRAKLCSCLGAVPDSPDKQVIISVLLDSYKSELIKTANSYPREHQFKVQLDKHNYEFVTSWHDAEGAYENVPGRFIKAVLEEYARKPLVERESIIFQDLIELINACVEAHLSLIITLSNGVRYEVRPYGVLTDPGNNYHYLVGYSREAGGKDSDKPSSFRLSKIRDFKIYYGRSGKLTELQRKSLEQRISAVGVQFLLQDPDTIRIRLSMHGKDMYDSQAHLRPSFISRMMESSGAWVYEFNCTQAQAQFYFFKFGADAEILCPSDLRLRFCRQYGKALSIYNQSST